MSVQLELLDANLIAHRLNEALLLGLRNTAELGQHLPALQGVEHGCRLQHEHAFEAIEIGQALLEVILVALAGNMAALDMLNEREGAGAVDVGSRRIRIFFQVLRRVDVVPRRAEMLEHRRIECFHVEHDGQRIGCFDRADIVKCRLARRDHAFRRVTQPVVGRLHIR